MQGTVIEDNKSLCRPLFLSLTLVVASIIFLFNIAPKLSSKTILERIKDSGRLVVVTRNSPTTYYEDVDGPAGLEYEMAQKFADRLGVKLTLLVPESLDDLLEKLDDQSAHIAAAGLTITEQRKKKFLFGPPYQEITEQLVYNIDNRRPKNLTQIENGTLEVVANSSHEERLKYLQEVVPGLSWKSNHKVESEELLEMVSDGIIDYTIADSNTLSLNQRYLFNLRAAFDVSEPQLLAWALPMSDDHSLLDEVRHYFKEIKENGELTQMIERNYGHAEDFDYVGTKIYRRHIETRLPQFQPLFEQAAEKYEVDWRLIAAIGYQESHWDPNAVSPTGVRGLMMLTLKTAKDLGINNRLDPKNSIFGGARYFKKTKQRIDKNILEPDRTWMAMAAYNVGYYHLQDARELARKQDKNPDRWVDVKTMLPLLAKRKWYKQTRYGFARGWEPVRYVENIRSYYDILKWVDDRKKEETSVPDEFLRIPNSL